MVALHPEGVDRNSIYEVLPAILELSPSTRRAWIEIDKQAIILQLIESPSTRRAWIEMPTPAPVGPRYEVALHPEGVDRNKN